MRAMPTRIAVLLAVTITSLAVIALSPPSWPTGAWGVFVQLVTSILAGAVVFGALFAIILLVMELISPGERVSSWQELAWPAAGLVLGVILVTLSPQLGSTLPGAFRFDVLRNITHLVSNLSQLGGMGLIVHSAYRLTREYIRRTQ